MQAPTTDIELVVVAESHPAKQYMDVLFITVQFTWCVKGKKGKGAYSSS